MDKKKVPLRKEGRFFIYYTHIEKPAGGRLAVSFITGRPALPCSAHPGRRCCGGGNYFAVRFFRSDT